MLSPIVRDVQRQRCCKRGSGDGQRLSLDYGTTERSFNAVERRGSTLTWTVCTAADSEERQICTTCLFAESVGLCLCFLPSCAMYKNNAVANVVAEMGRDLVLTTARLSDLSMPLKGEATLTCTVCTAADSEERQICTTCLFAESVGLWKRQQSYLYVCFLMYAFSHRDRGAHFCLRGGWGRGKIWRGIPQSNTKDQLPKPQQQLLRPCSGPSKVAYTRTTGLKNSK